MDTHVSKALQDKLYDKRKAGALEYVLFSVRRHLLPGGSVFAMLETWLR